MSRRERILVGGAVVALALFVAVAGLVGAGAFADLDRAILLGARARSSPTLDAAMLWLSTIGHGIVVIPLVGVLALWSLVERDARGAAILVAVGLATEAAVQLLKLGFARARPELWPRVEVLSFAFPSGHAMTSVAVFGMLAAVLARRRPSLRRQASIAVVPLALGIGLSRVYLGVHWPSDVLGGWLMGIALLATGYLALLRLGS